jgi:hypothetical protein
VLVRVPSFGKDDERNAAMILNVISTFDRLNLVKAALDKAGDGPKKTTAAVHYRAAEAARARRDELSTVMHINSAASALF